MRGRVESLCAVGIEGEGKCLFCMVCIRSAGVFDLRQQSNYWVLLSEK